MSPRLKIISLCAAFTLPLILFSSSMQPWTVEPVMGGVQEFLYPMERLWHSTSSWVKSSIHHYVHLSKAAEENTDLKNKIRDLEAAMMDYSHQEQEANRLRKLLNFTQRQTSEALPAEVVNHSRNTPFLSLRISRGSQDSLDVGMPATTPQGIVGKVLRTGLYHSDILLLDDNNFYLDVLIERTRTRGVLKGISQNRCRLLLHRRSEVRIGDTIITSGLVGAFPKGLPVGRVIKISYESDNVSQMITIEPWVNPEALEELLILKAADPQVENIIEANNREWIHRITGKL
ncbi:MAG: rod shape-determining protein MreC [Oligoflexales bacterium]